RPFDFQLSAAMGQLDCGQCGYLCHSYAEALALGSEKDVGLCVPGGKSTKDAVKRLQSIAGTLPAPKAAAKNGSTNGHANGSTNGVAGGSTNGYAPSAYSKTNPFPGRLKANRRLNGAGSAKDTRFIAVDVRSVAGAGLTYQTGDSLGIAPRVCPEMVQSVLDVLRATGAEWVADDSLRVALTEKRDLGRPSDALWDLLVATAGETDAADLSELRAEETAVDALGLLRRYPAVRPDPVAFAEALGRLQPRLYSISSSPLAHPDEVHLTVGVVRFETANGLRNGTASTFLSDRLSLGDRMHVFVQTSHGFRLPADDAAPVVMVGPGTGVAPFRAFLQERAAKGAVGKNWLFFGDQRSETDFLYRDELAAYQKTGLLTRLDLAFSRDQKEKLYVQHRMIENGAELYKWLEEGGCFYVCGDAKRMAKDVDAALHAVVAEHGALSAEAAKEYVAGLVKSKRYQRDVY
ncbi:MAG: sulfite reductase subunit alpha, partial [Planctomycetia bacterium]